MKLLQTVIKRGPKSLIFVIMEAWGQEFESLFCCVAVFFFFFPLVKCQFNVFGKILPFFFFFVGISSKPISVILAIIH